MQKKNIIKALLISTSLLIIPFTASLFVDGWVWTLLDYIFAWVLFSFLSLSITFIVKSSKSRTYKIVASFIAIAIFLLIWINAAVGIFSDENLNTNPSTISTSLGQKMTASDISITPIKIISDSRCPLDVQCIWAGTVEVQAQVESSIENREYIFKLNEHQTFGDYLITLIEFAPAKTSGTIPDSSYRFTFEIKKN